MQTEAKESSKPTIQCSNRMALQPKDPWVGGSTHRTMRSSPPSIHPSQPSSEHLLFEGWRRCGASDLSAPYRVTSLAHLGVVLYTRGADFMGLRCGSVGHGAR